MKALMRLFLFLSLASAAFGQGVINTYNPFPAFPGSPLAYVRDVPMPGTVFGPRLPSEYGRVELLTLDGTILTPTKDGTGDRLILDGVFSFGVMTIPDTTAGETAQIIVRAWDNRTGATFESALIAMALTVTFDAIGSRLAPSNFVLDSDFRGIQLPEPSAVALVAAGLAGLFLFLRNRGPRR